MEVSSDDEDADNEITSIMAANPVPSEPRESTSLVLWEKAVIESPCSPSGEVEQSPCSLVAKGNSGEKAQHAISQAGSPIELSPMSPRVRLVEIWSGLPCPDLTYVQPKQRCTGSCCDVNMDANNCSNSAVKGTESSSSLSRRGALRRPRRHAGKDTMLGRRYVFSPLSLIISK